MRWAEQAARTLVEQAGSAQWIWQPGVQWKVAAALEAAWAKTPEQTEPTRTIRIGPDLGAGVELAATESSERADLQEDLRGLAQHFAFEARTRVGQGKAGAVRQARRYAEVQAARVALERNGPPALTLEALIARLRRS